MQVDGACHCGAISFTAQVNADQAMVCHCLACQVLTGSAFRVVVPAPLASLALKGQPRMYERAGDSGAIRVQAFCPVCGTPLYAFAKHQPTQVSLRVGVLSQRDQITPRLQIWQQSAQAWLPHLQDVAACQRQEALG